MSRSADARWFKYISFSPFSGARVRPGRAAAGIAGLATFIIASCSTVTGPSLEAGNSVSQLVKLDDMTALPGWGNDNQFQALKAFRQSCKKLRGAPWDRVCSSAKTAVEQGGNNAARAFFQTHFEAFKIILPGTKRGFLTGYFQPEVRGSRTPSAEFSTPIYRKPNDFRKPYLARAEIEQGALRGRGLELVYLASPVDAFFIHVQGSARIALTDGSVMRIGFAAKNGQPYTSIGKVLIDKGELQRENVTMESIRDWFARHPGRVSEITSHNKSFIFFREITGGDPALGPIGAQGIPLTTERSLAVDRKFHKLGLPFWIDARVPDGQGGLAAFRQLMIAQDTGTAIVGAARGDIFFGSGDAAGRRAGPTQHNGDFYILLPKGAPLPSWAK